MGNAGDVEEQGERAAHAPAPRRLREYARLMRIDRPIGIWLLLWPVLWALWIAAAGQPDEQLFVIFVVGTFVMRSAGCVMNDFADREFDPHVRRTADRPLARQSVSTAEALGLFAVLGLAALALLIPLNRPTQVLALIGGVLAVTYPFLKRFFALPQAYLGLAVSWSVPMSFAAQTGELPSIARTTWSSASARRRSCSVVPTAASSRCCSSVRSPGLRWSGTWGTWAAGTGRDLRPPPPSPRTSNT